MSESDLESGLSGAAAVSRLREDLVAALEVSESARQENLELRQRLAELEEQISAMQRLMSLQDDTMAALQAGVGSGAEAAPGALPDAAPEAIEPPETAPASEKSAPPVAAPPLIPDLTGLIDTVLADPVMLGAAAFLLLMFATLGWLVVRRRQTVGASPEDLGNSDASADFAQVLQEPRMRAQPATAAAAVAPMFAAAGALDDIGAEAADESDDIGLDIMQAEDDEIDILAEADVYLAYRRFDKAEELLRDAIARDPGRKDLVLKLLEVHAGSGNAEAFVAEAHALHASMGSGDEGIWDKVAAMGRRLAPEHALFSSEGATSAASAGDAVEVPEVVTEFSAENVDDMELDFSRDMDLQDSGEDFAFDQVPADMPTVETDDVAEVARLPEEAAQSAPNAGDLDLTLDETAFATLDDAVSAAPEPEAAIGDAEVHPDAALTLDGNVEQAAELETGIPQEAEAGIDDDDLEKQLLAAAEQGNEVDWLSEIGNDLDFADMEGDESGGDFSGLISGEDEVGTKLDLARAYIDMGDQDSARSILSEVTEEGTEDQQREANDLMRRIG